MPAFRTVIFDCDSTLSTIEGIEELAVGHRAEVERLKEEVRAARDPAYLEALLRRMGWVRKDEEVRRWP